MAWRSGKRSVVPDAKPNCLYEIAEAGATEAPAPRRMEPVAPMFEDVSERLGHQHQEEPFDDFARQPLLPKRLSQLGPGVCWWDVDGDGWEDLIIGSGKGGQLAWYQNDGQGGFKRSSQAPWTARVSRDQTGIVGWAPGTVLVGSANYEDGQVSGAAVEAYGVGQVQASEMVGAWDGSAGPLAVADYDGDGELDLFVGGRVKAGRYPEAASSRLYHGRGGRLVLDEANSERLRDVGLVSGAVWSDLDGDGWPELILACEWGPLRVFHNNHGRLVAMDFPVSLPSGAHDHPQPPDGLVEWSDDGRPGRGWADGYHRQQLGTKHQIRTMAKKPLRIYYGDMAQSGEVQLLESYFEPEIGQLRAGPIARAGHPGDTSAGGTLPDAPVVGRGEHREGHG